MEVKQWPYKEYSTVAMKVSLHKSELYEIAEDTAASALLEEAADLSQVSCFW